MRGVMGWALCGVNAGCGEGADILPTHPLSARMNGREEGL